VFINKIRRKNVIQKIIRYRKLTGSIQGGEAVPPPKLIITPRTRSMMEM